MLLSVFCHRVAFVVAGSVGFPETACLYLPFSFKGFIVSFGPCQVTFTWLKPTEQMHTSLAAPKKPKLT